MHLHLKMKRKQSERQLCVYTQAEWPMRMMSSDGWALLKKFKWLQV